MNLSKQDLLRALGDPGFMQGEEDHSGSEQPVKHSADIDQLFKRSKQESKIGIVKVRSVGNALKDFQMVKCMEDRSRSSKDLSDNTVSWGSFNRARSQLCDTLLFFQSYFSWLHLVFFVFSSILTVNIDVS